MPSSSGPAIMPLENGKVEIRSARLLLRGAIEGDIEGLHEAFSDPEVMRYWSTPPHTSESETRTWISKMITFPQNGATDFIITLPGSTGTVTIGKIGVWQDCEIGFLLSRQYWGQGLAQEALSAILDYLFDEKGMQEITADVDPRNGRSIRVLEGMGFVKTRFVEKTFEIGGERVDSLYLGLRREVWEGRRQGER